MAWKVFSDTGLTALCSIIKQIRKTADSNMSAVSGLSGDLSELATQTAAALTEVNTALDDLDGGKQDKSDFQTVALAVSGWVANTDSETSAAGYAYTYNAAITGATAADGAETVIAVPSMEAAAACGLCATADVLEGLIRYYAVNAPTAEITVQVHLIKA